MKSFVPSLEKLPQLIEKMKNTEPFADLQVRLAEISPLEKQATALKKDHPDEAIALFRRVEDIEISKYQAVPQTILEIHLRIATILYEHRRFAEAEQLLLKEFDLARQWELTKKDIDKAEKEYKKRVRIEKLEKELGNSVADDTSAKRRDGAENPDFERNLYCLHLYSKLRIFYEKSNQLDKALVFAMAEAYARYENDTHDCYQDNPAPDYKAVQKILKKTESMDILEGLEAILAKYASESVVCENCWKMIEELQNLIVAESR